MKGSTGRISTASLEHSESINRKVETEIERETETETMTVIS
jgi:hypothetical protein